MAISHVVEMLGGVQTCHGYLLGAERSERVGEALHVNLHLQVRCREVGMQARTAGKLGDQKSLGCFDMQHVNSYMLIGTKAAWKIAWALLHITGICQ